MKEKTKSVFKSLTPVIFALIIGYVIILSSGLDASEAYKALFKGAFSSKKQIMNTLFAATPLLLTGLATMYSFKAGLYNMGAEGQLYLGGFAAAWVGFTVEGLPSWLHITLSLLAGCVVAMLYALLPAFLKAYLDVDEMVTTLMLNYVATLFTTWLASYPYRAPGSSNPQTISVLETAKIPRISSSSQLHYGFVIAMIIFLVSYIVMKRSVLGYKIKSIGENPDFSKYTGIKVKKNIVLIMLISAAISGLAGGIEVLGTHGKFVSGFSPDYGWTGLTIALIGKLEPVGIFIGAILFGALKTGGSTMEIMTGVPRSIVNILEGLIVLFVTVDFVSSEFNLKDKMKALLSKNIRSKGEAY